MALTKIAKPAHLRVIGSAGAKKVPIDPAQETKPEFNNGLEPPVKLKCRVEKRLWCERIQAAPWITKFDVERAYMWVHETARYLAEPDKFNGAKMAQLRALGCELALDPSSRTRIKIPQNAKTQAAKYFDNE